MAAATMPSRSTRKQAPPGWGDKVMHAELKIGENTILLSDGRGEGKTDFENFALTIIVEDPPKAERLFAALAEGGKVIMPVAKTFYSPAFGMLTDKFGVMWMVYVH
jgi:PhnB protein